MSLISDAARDLIVAEEVSSKAAYEARYQRPEWPGGRSGVTIGIGYDVGAGVSSAEQLRADWGGHIAPEMIAALLPCIGVTGDRAHALLGQVRSRVIVPWNAAIAVFDQVDVPRWYARCKAKLPNFEELSPDCKGALLSLAYNRGDGGFVSKSDRFREMAAIRAHMLARRFDLIPREFRSMKRLWPNMKGLVYRREHEAQLFERGLKAPASPSSQASTPVAATPAPSSQASTPAEVASTPPAAAPGASAAPGAASTLTQASTPSASSATPAAPGAAHDAKAGGILAAILAAGAGTWTFAGEHLPEILLGLVAAAVVGLVIYRIVKGQWPWNYNSTGSQSPAPSRLSRLSSAPFSEQRLATPPSPALAASLDQASDRLREARSLPSSASRPRRKRLARRSPKIRKRQTSSRSSKRNAATKSPRRRKSKSSGSARSSAKSRPAKRQAGRRSAR